MTSRVSVESLVMVRVALFAFVLLISPSVSAESTAPPPKEPATASSSHGLLAGFDILAVAGYGYSTTKVNGLEIEPFGGMFGLDIGYTFNSGFRLGARTSYGLGRSIAQNYDQLLRDDIPLTSDASSLTTALTIGYDLKVYALVLRHSIGIGFNWLKWDLGDIPYTSFAGYSPMKGSMFGGLIDPSLALLWQTSHFQCGVSIHYFVPFTEQVPGALVTEALVGVRL